MNRECVLGEPSVRGARTRGSRPSVWPISSTATACERCTIVYETMKAVKETLNRMFWAIIGLLGTVTAGLIVALATVLLRVLAKANIL